MTIYFEIFTLKRSQQEFPSITTILTYKLPFNRKNTVIDLLLSFNHFSNESTKKISRPFELKKHRLETFTETETEACCRVTFCTDKCYNSLAECYSSLVECYCQAYSIFESLKHGKTSFSLKSIWNLRFGA